MPRRRKGKVIAQCEIEAITIQQLAESGLMVPGEEQTGYVESLIGDVHLHGRWVPVRTKLEADFGEVYLRYPFPQTVRVVKADVRPERPYPFWYFLCGKCNRRCRILCRPLKDGLALLLCIQCHHVRHRWTPPNSDLVMGRLVRIQAETENLRRVVTEAQKIRKQLARAAP